MLSTVHQNAADLRPTGSFPPSLTVFHVFVSHRFVSVECRRTADTLPPSFFSSVLFLTLFIAEEDQQLKMIKIKLVFSGLRMCFIEDVSHRVFIRQESKNQSDHILDSPQVLLTSTLTKTTNYQNCVSQHTEDRIR